MRSRVEALHCSHKMILSWGLESLQIVRQVVGNFTLDLVQQLTESGKEIQLRAVLLTREVSPASLSPHGQDTTHVLETYNTGSSPPSESDALLSPISSSSDLSTFL